MDTANAERAREYYRALDEHDYGAFEALLAPEFVHERPDRTLDGRDRFVRFMREERPERDTRHRVDAVYHSGDDSDATGTEGRDVAVRGRLLDSDGEDLMAFVDVFSISGGLIERIDTYVQSN